jgi:hypothetical protein
MLTRAKILGFLQLKCAEPRSDCAAKGTSGGEEVDER